MDNTCTNFINTPILQDTDPCEGDTMSTLCIIEPSALTELGLPVNSTQHEINLAIQTALINLESNSTVADDLNNIVRTVNLRILDNTKLSAVTALNIGSPVIVEENDILLIYSTNISETIPNQTTTVYTLRNIGKGVYGSGGTMLTEEDITIVSILGLTPSAVLDNDSTQFIDLGDVGSSDIVTAFNAHTFTGDEDPVQEQSEGYVLLDVTIDGEDLQYLFVGSGGSYGTTGVEVAVSSDFVAFNSTDNGIPLLQGLQSVLDVSGYAQTPDGNSYIDLKLANGSSGYLDLWFSTGSDFGGIFVIEILGYCRSCRTPLLL